MVLGRSDGTIEALTYLPSVEQFFPVFDILLEKLWPEVFSENWVEHINGIPNTYHWHELLNKKLHSNILNCSVPLPEGLPEDKIKITIPPFTWLKELFDGYNKGNNEKLEKISKYYERIDSLKNKKESESGLNFRKCGEYNLLNFNLSRYNSSDLSNKQKYLWYIYRLIIQRFIWNFAKEETFGRPFFSMHYGFRLLSSSFPTLNKIQAKRFFYWGILKFSPMMDLSNWRSEPKFKNYLQKFND